MTFSVGVLYSGQTLLEVVESGALDLQDFATSFGRIGVADGPTVLAAAQRCHWIAIREDGAIRLTERGETLRRIGPAHLCLREQLLDVISNDPQSWCGKLMYGRSEALKFMPDAARQCFKDGALTTGEDESIVRWWEQAGSCVRAERSRLNYDLGRKAEKLSLEYEERRTGRRPLWQSLESSFSGFDVLSVAARGSRRKLKIEVKGSHQRRNEAQFHISRNEWNTAQASRDYQFHLWLMHENNPTVLVVPSAALTSHVPQDGNMGRWTQAQLFYKTFTAFEQRLSPVN